MLADPFTVTRDTRNRIEKLHRTIPIINRRNLTQMRSLIERQKSTQPSAGELPLT